MRLVRLVKGRGNVSLDRAVIHARLRDMARESGKPETWGVRHSASVTPFVWRRSQELDGVTVTAAYRVFSLLPSHLLEL